METVAHVHKAKHQTRKPAAHHDDETYSNHTCDHTLAPAAEYFLDFEVFGDVLDALGQAGHLVLVGKQLADGRAASE